MAKQKEELKALYVINDNYNSDAYGDYLDSNARLLRVKKSRGELRALYVDFDGSNSDASGSDLDNGARLLRVKR